MKTTRPTFVKIDASFLPSPWSPKTDGQPSSGLIATFYADGQLEQLAIYRNGEVYGDTLSLAHGISSGRSGNSEQWDVYSANGTVERFDAWSDNSRPRPMDWTEWVQKEIARIAR